MRQRRHDVGPGVVPVDSHLATAVLGCGLQQRQHSGQRRWRRRDVRDGQGAEIRDGRTGRLRASGPTAGEDEIVNTVLSGDGRVLATVLSSGTVVLVDTANGSVLQTLEAQALPIPDNGWPGTIAEPMLAISPDGQFVATWHAVTGVQLWDATTGQSIAVLDGRQIVETRIDDADASSPGDQAGALTFNHAGNVLVLKDLQSLPSSGAGARRPEPPTGWCAPSLGPCDHLT